jgi:hypothetical protein
MCRRPAYGTKARIEPVAASGSSSICCDTENVHLKAAKQSQSLYEDHVLNIRLVR